MYHEAIGTWVCPETMRGVRMAIAKALINLIVNGLCWVLLLIKWAVSGPNKIK
jgi:hypothetical protein